MSVIGTPASDPRRPPETLEAVAEEYERHIMLAVWSISTQHVVILQQDCSD